MGDVQSRMRRERQQRMKEEVKDVEDVEVVVGEDEVGGGSGREGDGESYLSGSL